MPGRSHSRYSEMGAGRHVDVDAGGGADSDYDSGSAYAGYAVELRTLAVVDRAGLPGSEFARCSR